MGSAFELIDFKNPVFLSFAFWSTILALKTMYMSVHTAIFRFKNQVCFKDYAATNVTTTLMIFGFLLGICQCRRWWCKMRSVQCRRSRTCSTVKKLMSFIFPFFLFKYIQTIKNRTHFFQSPSQ